MNIQNKYTNLGKSILSGALCAGVLSASMGAQAAVSQIPLNLAEGVPPNMILTLDDSGSMRMAYVPDSLRAKAGTDRISKRMKSSTFNVMYYNPAIKYEIPKQYNSAGVELGRYTVSFDKAHYNGYKQTIGSVDLNSEYRVSSWFDISKKPDDTSTDPYDATYSSSGYRQFEKNPTDTPFYKEGYWDGSGKNRHWVPGYDYRQTRVAAYYYKFDTSKKKDSVSCQISLHTNEDDCYTYVDVSKESAEQKQNFANWYSFYRNRALATLTAARFAFDETASFRLTWQALNSCSALDVNTDKCGNSKFSAYNTKHRGDFFSFLDKVYFSSGTPLHTAMKQAGDFLSKDVAWHKYPNDTGNTDKNTYACRPSYHIMMTDGMWNSRNSITGGNLDGNKKITTIPQPDTKFTGVKYSVSEYTPQAPYKDDNTISLAGLAFKYWATDLKKSLDNKTPQNIVHKNDDKNLEFWDPRNNPASWQSMSNFIVGLGLTSSLDSIKYTSYPTWNGDVSAPTFANYDELMSMSSATKKWPSVADDADPGNVYDLWHAAINSRGEFFSADSPESVVQAFKNIMDRIANKKSSAAMPGISSSVEADDSSVDRLVSYFYQTSFNSEDWSGDVKKVKKFRIYDSVNNTFTDKVEDDWTAKSQLPAPNNRLIYISKNGSLVKFSNTESSVGNYEDEGTLAYYLNQNPELIDAPDGKWVARVGFLQGDTTNTDFRERSSGLGDFLSSQPVVVSGGRYLEGFANRLEGNTAYTNFMTTLPISGGVMSRRGQLYIGGNDGMLHAFDTATGKEKFAFIPTAVFPKLHKLTGKNYKHEFYVDGTPVVADVYDKDKSKWRTILVGTLRAGGKGLFALDITNPDDIQLLWEFGENSIAGEDAVKPGYSFPQPTVARMHNGMWAVVTGNGYEGEGAGAGKAALYIIDAIKGTMIKSLEVQSDLKTSNGLSTPRLADYDSDGVADYAYAGDLHGNLWRFDLLGKSASAATLTPPSNGSYGGKNDGDDNFKVSYGGKPMFIATSAATATESGVRQPITTAPNLVRHPTRKGYLVMVGTGKYFEVGDNTGVRDYPQSVYGIWDMKTKAETTGVDTIARTQLVEQTITSETTGTASGKISGQAREARIMSNNPVEWYTNSTPATVNKRGWILDLTSGALDGEMMVENMRTLGSMLLLQTLVPNDDPCANGATNWLYAINPATGGRTLHHAFDTRVGDTIVSGIKFGSEGGVSISQNEKGFTANAPGDTEAISPPADSMGRQTWRMVPDA